MPVLSRIFQKILYCSNLRNERLSVSPKLDNKLYKPDPLLSIVTIVKNGEDNIDRTINAIVSQKSSETEYIVKDGFSDDQTIEILLNHTRDIDLLVIGRDQGISEAFNKAVSYARGRYLLFVNADDWICDNALEIITNSIKNDHFGSDIYCFGCRFLKNGQEVNIALSNPEKIIHEPSIHHASCVIKKSTFEELGGFDINYRYAMDYAFFLDCFMNGVRFKSSPEIIANRSLGGLSYRNNLKGIRETMVARSKYFSGIELYRWYYYSVFKNLAGRTLRRFRLGSIYRAYWKFINKKWT